MDPGWAAPPAAERCLVFSYASRGQKGGTIIDESVVDLAAHDARMRDPASYRPEECRCGGRTLHVHGRRDRCMLGSAVADGGLGAVTVMVFICTSCVATWRVLPAFLARHLWRAWEVVEGVVTGRRRADAPPVPRRTQSRWRARLAQTARVPRQVLATSGSAALRELVGAMGLDADREALATEYARRLGTSLLAPLAALLHRFSPGVRLV